MFPVAQRGRSGGVVSFSLNSIKPATSVAIFIQHRQLCGFILYAPRLRGTYHSDLPQSSRLTLSWCNGRMSRYKECLALILALQHFGVYVSSSKQPVIVFTDHNPLLFLHKMKNKNQRLLRWSLMLQEHGLGIRHIKGNDNVIADSLSRV